MSMKIEVSPIRGRWLLNLLREELTQKTGEANQLNSRLAELRGEVADLEAQFDQIQHDQKAEMSS